MVLFRRLIHHIYGLYREAAKSPHPLAAAVRHILSL